MLYLYNETGTRSGVGVTFCKRRRLCCIVAALMFASPIGLVCGAYIECHPLDCADIQCSHHTSTSGFYTFHSRLDHSKTIRAFCDLVTDGGGWTVLLRRIVNGTLSFAKTFADYREGFSALGDSEFWLGLKYVHAMTGTPQILHIEFTSIDGKAYKVGYDDLYVGDEQNNASLRLGRFIKGVSTTDDAFSVHNGSRFQTSDSYQSNCTVSLGGGGWWFPLAAGCGDAYLTGAGSIEGNTNRSTQMYWTGKAGRIYLKEVTMKFRDKDFNNSGQTSCSSSCPEEMTCKFFATTDTYKCTPEPTSKAEITNTTTEVIQTTTAKEHWLVSYLEKYRLAIPVALGVVVVNILLCCFICCVCRIRQQREQKKELARKKLLREIRKSLKLAQRSSTPSSSNEDEYLRPRKSRGQNLSESSSCLSMAFSIFSGSPRQDQHVSIGASAAYVIEELARAVNCDEELRRERDDDTWEEPVKKPPSKKSSHSGTGSSRLSKPIV